MINGELARLLPAAMDSSPSFRRVMDPMLSPAAAWKDAPWMGVLVEDVARLVTDQKIAYVQANGQPADPIAERSASMLVLTDRVLINIRMDGFTGGAYVTDACVQITVDAISTIRSLTITRAGGSLAVSATFDSQRAALALPAWADEPLIDGVDLVDAIDVLCAAIAT